MRLRDNAIRTVCVLAIIIFTAVTIWDFSIQLQNALTKETYRTLSLVSEDYNKAFSERISYNVKTMKVLAGSLGQMQGCTKQKTMDILQSSVDEGGFKRMVVCDPNGISCANDGVSTDVSDRIYFKNAIMGQIDVSEPIISTVSGEESIVIAVPIHGKNEITGVLFGIYPLSTSGGQLLDFTYYSDGYGFIVSTDGKIILSSEHADKLANEENLFSFFEKADMADFSLDELKSAMKNGEKKSFEFSYNGQKRYVSLMPSGVNNWYTFSISSDAMMQQQKDVTSQMMLRLVFRIVVVGVLLFAWILMHNRRHNKQIRMANQKYQSLLTHINGGMIVAKHAKVADETIVNYVSSGFTDMTGYTLEDIKNIHQGKYLNVILEEDRKAVFEKYLEQLKVGNTYWMPYRILKKDGSIIWVMDNGYLVEDAEGMNNHSIITDITAVKQQEEELRMSENRFSVAINASSGTMFEVDLKNKCYTHFENAERMFGMSSEKLLSDTNRFSLLPYEEYVVAITNYFFHPDDHEAVIKTMKKYDKGGTTSFEARLRRADNSYIWARVDISVILDEFGSPLRLVGYMSDIDDIKKQAEFLENKIQTDPMTGLYNKVATGTLANKLLRDNKNSLHALIVLDIDNFKGINDTLGHAFGDIILIEVCTKLKALFRSNDIVGRVGGDEFAIVMRDVPDKSRVLKKAAELSKTFSQTYVGEKENYKISCSMGIIMIEDGNESFETLYRKADAALYQAKRNGKDQFVLYRDEESDSYPIENTRTNDEELQSLQLSHDIEEHIFELLYTAQDFNISINMALAAIGQRYHVSRVAIFENMEDDLKVSNIYEWCNEGIPSKIDELQNIDISHGDDSILDCFDKNGLLYCNDVGELPSYLKNILESKGVLSTLKVTITNDKKTCGFIGFDECKEHRVWTGEEIEKLSYLSKLLSVFLFKKRTEVALLENLNTRLKILDILPDYICVINPETHVLEYTNKKMQELLPSAIQGAFCFVTMRGGLDCPCGNCILEQIKHGNTDNLEIISEDKNVHLKVRAISINWTKDQQMVLIYGSAKDIK